MKILDRYFSRQIWGAFVGFGAVLCALAWMVQILLLMKLIVKYGINAGDFLGMSLFTIPMLAGIITPFVIFIAVTFIYNKMIGTSEITVITASGQSWLRTARPAIIISIIIAVMHFAAGIWVVPKTQDKFYSMQWELRYGLGHLKLRESQFNQLMSGVVIYVEQVNKKDLYGMTIRDGRRPGEERIISSETGKLINTPKGISIVMGQGGLQTKGKNNVMIGSFDAADMDMDISDSSESRSIKARRMSTPELLKTMNDMDSLDRRGQSKVYAEVASRFLSPFMDIMFVLIAAACLLKSSALRRRASYSSLYASILMIGAEVLFMTLSTSLSSVAGLWWLGAGQAIVIAGLVLYLRK